MFNIYVNDKKDVLPEDDICYIVAKEGIYLKKKIGIMESIAPVDKISTLESITSSAKMHIKKIPSTSFAKIVDFFKEVHKAYYSEAIVLLFYQEDTQKYRVVPPHQKVSAGSVDYDRITLDGWNLIGTIHSHGSMSAFHSGIDDTDENTFDGLHITIGNVNSAANDFSISASIVANGFRVIVEPEEYIDGIKKTVDIDKQEPFYYSRSYKYVQGQGLVIDDKKSKKSFRGIFDKRYVSIAAPSKSISNPNWMKVVEKGGYQWNRGRTNFNTTNRFGFDRYAGGFGGNGWGGHYDPHAWSQRNPNALEHQVKNQVIIDNTNIDNDDSIPCMTCKYRNEKLLAEETCDLDEPIYQCTKCDTLLKEDDLTEEMCCPECKTGNHLILIDDNDLDDKYIKDISSVNHVSGFYTCPNCKVSYMRDESVIECPYCKFNADECDKESETETQMSTDSGQYLGDMNDNVHETVIEQAQGTKIPDPKQQTLPLQSKDGSLMSMFKRVFKK